MKQATFKLILFSLCFFALLTTSCQKGEAINLTEEAEVEESLRVDKTTNLLTTIDCEIYYYSTRNSITNIYKMDASGVEQPIIIDDDHQDWWVRVSPNKDKMLWYKSSKSGKKYNNYKQAELWMANIDGTNPQKVIDLDDYNWKAQGVADWSPDGTEIVMAAEEKGGHWHLFITDANGDNPQKISQRDAMFLDPSWSPDGQKIVYTAVIDNYQGNIFNIGQKFEIHVMDKDGSNEIQLTDDFLRDHDPYWSPDGTEIAFETWWDTNIFHCGVGKWSIRKYNFDTEAVTDVVKDPQANAVPRWTEDSEKVYFNRKECIGRPKVVRANRDGSNMETVIENDAYPIYDVDLVY